MRLLAIVLLSATLACGEGDAAPPKPSPLTLTIVEGDGQSGEVGSTLATVYSVRVAGDDGAPRAGITVMWGVTGGEGSITAAGVTTDAGGIARATRTLGTKAGTATAKAEAVMATVVFTATARAAPAAKMSKVGGDAQMGAPGIALAKPFETLVQDRFDNPVENVILTWAVSSGGGAVPPASASDVAGIARATLTLGDLPGPASATATATGLAGSPLVFTATGAEPVLVTSVPVPGNYGIHDQLVRDGLVFVSAWNSGVMLYDVGNGIRGGTPQSPAIVTKIVTNGGEAHNVWWFQNPVTKEKRYLFVGQEGPGTVGSSSSGDIHVVDASDLANKKEVGFFHRPNAGTHNFWMDEASQILYAAYYNGGVVAIDVSGTLSGDISSRAIDTIAFGAGSTYVWGVQLYKGSLYATDMLSGLWQLGTMGGKLSVASGGNNNVPERFSSDLWASNDHVYTGTWGNRMAPGNALKVWKLGQTGAPTLVDTILTTGVGTVSDVEVTDDDKLLMFSAEGPSSGFYFYRLVDPDHPKLVGKYLVNDNTQGIHTATFGRIGGRLYAFGARDPSAPALVILDVTNLDL